MAKRITFLTDKQSRSDDFWVKNYILNRQIEVKMVEVYDAIDSAARTGLSIVLLLWLVSYGTVFEVEYNPKLVEMYKHPWWRMLVGLLLVAASMWCPRVGIMAAMVVFFYFMDLETLTYS